MTSQQDSMEQWDRYWAYGNVHSFSQVGEANYRGAVAAFWAARFEQLAAGSRVLDIASGNGAVALLALEASDRLSRDFDVSGVDLADIDPVGRVTEASVLANLKRIRFQGRTPAESLPFDDGVIEAACSQFGLEYSDPDRAVPEIARVLAPGGRLFVIAHHTESIFLAATRAELEQLDFVLNEVKLYLRARNLLRAMGQSKGARKSPKLERKRRAVGEAMEAIQKAAEARPDPSMLLGPARYVREIFSAVDRTDPGELSKWLDEAQARVTANRRRLLDMREAALDEAALRSFLERLRRAGFHEVDHGPFHQDDGGLLGWRLEARRGGPE